MMIRAKSPAIRTVQYIMFHPTHIVSYLETIKSANSQSPDAVTLLIERKLTALAYHQHTAELRCANGRCGAAPFSDLLVLIEGRAMPENSSER
jgi:hypothetical protein